MRTSVKIWLSLIPGMLFVALLVYLIAQRAGDGGTYIDDALGIVSFTASAHFPWILPG